MRGVTAQIADPSLFQVGQGGPEIKVQHMTIHDQRRHGFHTGRLRFGHAGAFVAEVDDTQIDGVGVQVADKKGFGFETNQTTGVIKRGDGFHEDEG